MALPGGGLKGSSVLSPVLSLLSQAELQMQWQELGPQLAQWLGRKLHVGVGGAIGGESVCP